VMSEKFDIHPAPEQKRESINESNKELYNLHPR